jgi:acyl-CoA synthetase (AMP-forming)/AMP-acid ligase II
MVASGPASGLPDYPSTYWELVERAAVSRADHIVLSDDYGRTLSAGDLRNVAVGLARHLYQLGIGPGTVTSWQLPTSLEAMVVMAALARLSAVQNPIIPLLREREVGFITREVTTEFLIVPEEWRGFNHGALARSLAEETGLTPVILDHRTDPTLLDGALRLPNSSQNTLPPPARDPNAVRWIYYSSGTTADPKGVRHSDSSVMAGATGSITVATVTDSDVNPLAFPITHIGGAAMLAAGLMSGMRCVLFDAFDAEGPERFATHRPTLLGSAVPFFVAFAAAQRRHGPEPLYPNVRAFVGGGAPVPIEVSREIRAVFGVAGVANAWGLTEFPAATFPRLDSSADVLDRTAGPPVTGVAVRVVGNDGSELGVGEVGELQLQGPQCFHGYVDTRLNAQAFDAEGWFRSGDLGFIDDAGNVAVTGRLKDIIIRNAENISALELEEALSQEPRIAEVAVVGVPDPRVGERVGAVVVVREGFVITLEDLATHCRRLGIAAQKRPERLRFVDALPRNPMGKVLKQQLREEWEAE